jgi:hypothetical protein
MTIRLYQLLPVLLLLVTPMAIAEPDEGIDNAEPRRCINTGWILRTKIIDDANIVFIMRRNEIYLNTLRSRCTGLTRRGSFAYSTQTRSLCELERITVIEGGGIGRPLGRTCSLGQFQPVTMEELAARFVRPIPQPEEVATPDIEEVTGKDTEKDVPDAE